MMGKVGEKVSASEQAQKEQENIMNLFKEAADKVNDQVNAQIIKSPKASPVKAFSIEKKEPVAIKKVPSRPVSGVAKARNSIGGPSTIQKQSTMKPSTATI